MPACAARGVPDVRTALVGLSTLECQMLKDAKRQMLKDASRLQWVTGISWAARSPTALT